MWMFGEAFLLLSPFVTRSCREEVTRKLKDARDGSFLVRNSNRAPGEFTLTVRKGGQNKLLRIICKNNRYGFSEPTKFESVPKLVDYFRSCNLMEHNSQLDVILDHPISRFDVRFILSSTFFLPLMSKIWPNKAQKILNQSWSKI